MTRLLLLAAVVAGWHLRGWVERERRNVRTALGWSQPDQQPLVWSREVLAVARKDQRGAECGSGACGEGGCGIVDQKPACPHYATTEHGCRTRCDACGASFRNGEVPNG